MKLIFKRKKRFILWIFWMKEKLVLWISGSKRRSISIQLIKRLSFIVFTKLLWYLKNRERWSFSSQKNDKLIFHVAWKTKFTVALKALVLNFSEMVNTVVFEPESWCKDNVYWLMNRSCLKLFGDKTYGPFIEAKSW